MTPRLFLLWLMSIPCFAQPGSIHGVVRSEGQPIPFAHVQLDRQQAVAITDTLGRFTIAKVLPGHHTLHTSSIGYFPSTVTVQVAAGRTTEVEIGLKEDVSQLDAVVVTGTMREVTKLASPIPVEVYSPTFFRKNPTPNIFESLAIVNGVQPQINCNVCNTGDIHINGLEGPYTMILIDGMPIVSSLSTVYGLSGIPNSLVKRMEIVKGPASTLYGSEAVAGVINIITKEPWSSPAFKADVFGTSLGEYNADISTAFKIKKVNSLLGLNYFNYSRPIDINGDNFTDVTLQERVSLFNKWAYEWPSGRNGSVAMRYVHENRWGGELQWTPAYRGTDIYYGESILTDRVELIGNQSLTRDGSMQLDYSFNDHHQDSYYGKVKYDGHQQVAFLQARWKGTAGKHDWLAGLPFRYVYYDDNTAGTATVSGANQPSLTYLPGLFIQDEMNVNPNLTLLGGVRYDHHNIHGNIFTERLSFKYGSPSLGTFRLTAGSGYRVINLFTEDHAALTGARTVVIRNDLKPERSWNINANYSKTIDLPNGILNVDGSLFYTYFTNKIVGDFNTDPNLIIYDNLNGYAISQGLTLNTDLSFSSGFKLLSGITLMDVYRIDRGYTDNKIPQLYAPAFSGTFSASYTWEPLHLSIDLNGKINGPMHLPVVPNDYRPAMSPWYALVNLQLTRSFSSRWEIYGGVKNLFNFIPADPLLRPFDPFDKNITVNNPYGYTFDTSYNYAPLQGAKAFLGVRLTVN
ncbi:MAG: TonB-dependent receptor [Bacteroidetes bacterium]|nr:TonB-dependent receptor [Bacteroidota bacterium]